MLYRYFLQYGIQHMLYLGEDKTARTMLLNIPFFHQTTQLHINEWSYNDFDKFEEFIKKNKDKIISYEEMLAKKTDNLIIKLLNKLIKILLISYRKFF